MKDRKFTPEALVIVALMRKLGIVEVSIEDLDLREPEGLVLGWEYGRKTSVST